MMEGATSATHQSGTVYLDDVYKGGMNWHYFQCSAFHRANAESC